MKNSNVALTELSILIATIALCLSLFVTYSIRIKHSCVDSGHNFESRYSKVMPDKEKIEAVKDLWATISQVKNARGGIDLKYEEIYQGEVCTYCGVTDISEQN